MVSSTTSGQAAVAKAYLCAGLHPLAGLCQVLTLVALYLPLLLATRIRYR
jgi:hypothetical protein